MKKPVANAAPDTGPTDDLSAWTRTKPVPLELSEHEIEAIVAIFRSPPPPTPALIAALARR